MSATVEVEREAATLMPTTTLIRTPKDSGLYVLKGADVLPLPTARLKRETKTIEGTKRRRYCITGPRGKALPVPAGDTQFLDVNAAPWRLFKLDVDGCAYKDAKDTKGRWQEPRAKRATQQLPSNTEHLPHARQTSKESPARDALARAPTRTRYANV